MLRYELTNRRTNVPIAKPRFPTGGGVIIRYDTRCQSCPWVGLTHGFGWVGSGWVEIFQFWMGWVGLDHHSKSTKYLKGLF